MTEGTTSPDYPVSPAAPTASDLTSPTDPTSHTSHTSEIVRLNLAGLSGTGDTRVDEVVAQLRRLDEAPLGEHPAILGHVHDRLREVLGELSPGDPQRPNGTP